MKIPHIGASVGHQWHPDHSQTAMIVLICRAQNLSGFTPARNTCRARRDKLLGLEVISTGRSQNARKQMLRTWNRPRPMAGSMLPSVCRYHIQVVNFASSFTLQNTTVRQKGQAADLTGLKWFSRTCCLPAARAGKPELCIVAGPSLPVLQVSPVHSA